MAAGWCSRTLRAAVFAAVCVLLAALGHVMLSGSRVPGLALVGGAAVAGVVGWCLAGRERGIPLIVSVVVVLQAVLHSAFSLVPQEVAGRARASTGEGSTNHDTGSTHMGSMPMDLADMSQVSTGHLEHTGHTMSGSSSFGMLAAHLLAALLCGLWLAYGECAAFRILRAVAGWLAAPLRLLLALPVPPHRTRVHARRREDQSPRRLLLHYAITSRGPPMGTAVA